MVPPPKNPIKYQIYIQRQRESKLGQIAWNEGYGNSPKDIMRRFNSKYVIKDSGCWEWQTFIPKSTGYGRFWVNGKDVSAHRFSYEMFNGPIPENLTVDHICKNRVCVNPYHLDLVTRVENVLRSENKITHNKELTHCPQGHEYNSSNTYITKANTRQCRTCTQNRNRIRKLKLKSKKLGVNT